MVEYPPKGPRGPPMAACGSTYLLQGALCADEGALLGEARLWRGAKGAPMVAALGRNHSTVRAR